MQRAEQPERAADGSFGQLADESAVAPKGLLVSRLPPPLTTGQLYKVSMGKDLKRGWRVLRD